MSYWPDEWKKFCSAVTRGRAMVEAVPFQKKEGRFKVGDVVYLKSKSGPFDVTAIQTNGDVMCDWISDLGEPQQCAYPPDVLVKEEDLMAMLAKAKAARRTRITREPPKRRKAK